MCSEVYLASFLSLTLATQSAADSVVPVAKLGKSLGLGVYVPYESTPPITSALLPDHTGQKQQNFPILSLRGSNRKTTKASVPTGPS